MSAACVFVAAHGAAITNAMFMASKAAVIELFNYKWAPDMYRRMLNQGIPYTTSHRSFLSLYIFIYFSYLVTKMV